MQGKIKMRMDLKPLKRLQMKSPKDFEKSMEVAAIQFLTWCNKGSKAESRIPPIRWGVLRGSSSAFVGNKLVTIFDIMIKPGALDSPTPAQSGGMAGLIITWVWNTDYAAKMHEWKGGWGKFTKQSTNAGKKWLEMHLRRDRDALMDVIRIQFKKETGL